MRCERNENGFRESGSEIFAGGERMKITWSVVMRIIWYYVVNWTRESQSDDCNVLLKDQCVESFWLEGNCCMFRSSK